jgi:hypothetical protein
MLMGLSILMEVHLYVIYAVWKENSFEEQLQDENLLVDFLLLIFPIPLQSLNLIEDFF